jgi:hypothetical protein
MMQRCVIALWMCGSTPLGQLRPIQALMNNKAVRTVQNRPRASLPASSEQLEACTFDADMHNTNMKLIEKSIPRMTLNPDVMSGTKVWLTSKQYAGKMKYTVKNDMLSFMGTNNIIGENSGLSWWVAVTGAWYQQLSSSFEERVLHSASSDRAPPGG